ncbi:MAG: PAS domain S-box protein [Candidatus Lokiarchaeota archaeon]|nr:PAS domain S-box protein [Candidatus Lokiarchaeota archaeon]
MPRKRTDEPHSILGHLMPDDIEDLIGSKGTIMVYLSRTGEILDISHSGCDLLGYSKEELVGKNWFESILPADVAEKLTDSYKKMIQKRDSSIRKEFNPRQYNPVLTKNGQTRLITWRTKILFDEDGSVKGSISYGYDITDIQQIETTLRATELELSLKNRISETFLKITDKKIYAAVLNILLEATDSKYGIFGYIREDGAMVSASMTSEIWEECEIPEKDLVFPKESWKGIWGEAMLTKKSHIKNEPNVVPDGHVPIVRSLVVPLVYGESLIGVITVANKNTPYQKSDLALMESLAEIISPILHTRLERDRQSVARAEVEKELRASEKRYRELYSKAPAGLVRSRVADGSIVECNEKLALMLGYESREAYLSESTAYDAYVNPEDRLRFAEIIQFAGKATDYEVLLKRKDGSTFWALMNAHIVPNTDIIETVIIDITAEKETKDLIAYQRDFFKAVIDSLALPFYVVNTEDLSLSIANKLTNSDRFEEPCCYQLLGESKPCFEIGLDCPIKQIKQTKSPVTVVHERVGDDGLLQVYEIHGHPIFSENGDVKRLIEYVVDVTERHQREALFRIQKDLGFILSSGIGLDRGFNEILKAVIRIPGIDYALLHFPTSDNIYELRAQHSVPEELLSHLQKLHPKMVQYISDKEPSYIEEFDDIFEAHFERGMHASCIIPLLHEDEVIAALTVSSLKLKRFPDAVKNALESLSTLVSGFIARAQAEVALRESEERYRSLFESSRDGIAITDLDGYVVDANSSFLEMVGYTLEELGEIPYEQFTPSRWKEFEDEIVQNQVLGRGYSDPYEKEYIRKDGSTIPIRLRVWLVLDENDEPIRMLAIVRDITEEKKIAEERTLQNRELELYASLLHHDLSNDLQVLMTSIQALELLETPESTSYLCMVDSAKASAERMGHLLQVLGRPVEAENRIIPLIESVAKNAEEVHSGMTVLVKPKRGTKKIRVFGSRLLPMVFENLLRNSAQHAGENATVEINITKTDDWIEVLLSDDGPGVSSDIIPRLFEKGVSTKDGGFGLYLAKQILAVYDGTIEYIRSESGASFKITLKIAK